MVERLVEHLLSFSMFDDMSKRPHNRMLSLGHIYREQTVALLLIRERASVQDCGRMVCVDWPSELHVGQAQLCT